MTPATCQRTGITFDKKIGRIRMTEPLDRSADIQPHLETPHGQTPALAGQSPPSDTLQWDVSHRRRRRSARPPSRFPGVPDDLDLAAAVAPDVPRAEPRPISSSPAAGPAATGPDELAAWSR